MQSAMGPGRDMQDKPSARVKNIETFEVCTMYMDDDQIPQIYCKIKETLRAFLATNDYLRYKDLVTFHQYNTEEEVFVMIILIVMTIAPPVQHWGRGICQDYCYCHDCTKNGDDIV